MVAIYPGLDSSVNAYKELFYIYISMFIAIPEWICFPPAIRHILTQPLQPCSPLLHLFWSHPCLNQDKATPASSGNQADTPKNHLKTKVPSPQHYPQQTTEEITYLNIEIGHYD